MAQQRSRGRWKGGDTKDPRRNTKAYRDAVAAVRLQVQLLGVPCYFWRRKGYEDCPGQIDLSLDYRARWGFTTHHLDKLMDGQGDPTDVTRIRPAHRSCNSRDGLIAQNARRNRNVKPTHRPSARPVDGWHADQAIVDEVAWSGIVEQPRQHGATQHGERIAQAMMYLDTTDSSDPTSRSWPQPSDTYTQ